MKFKEINNLSKKFKNYKTNIKNTLRFKWSNIKKILKI